MKRHDARRRARFNPSGSPVPLPEQDRTRWDHEAIRLATALLEQALSAAKPGPFQIEAAISADHCRASSAESTEWREIAALYALLETFRPTPSVRVNRAFAVGRSEGPREGLALLEHAGEPEVSGYPYVHIVRGALLEELGRHAEARDALLLARQHARNAAERSQIDSRLATLERSRRA